MARVTNPKDELVNGAGSYIINEIQLAISDFHEEKDVETKLDAAYVAARDGSAKTHLIDAVRLLRWLIETEFTRVPPTPLTNAEVDALRPDIRTFEDGT